MIDDAKPSDPCAKPKSTACKFKRKKQADADARSAQTEVERQLQALLKAVLAIAKIAADELGITAGIKCFTSGDLGACGETALNILGSLAGGLAPASSPRNTPCPGNGKRHTSSERPSGSTRVTPSPRSRTGWPPRTD
ncbi:hypothetical protein [Nonomuraea wenchangensis]|uniref:hypothetical protein n=1 Tax=Nonomuraea wenchangensis TaxID=568860 RepID=UPI003417D04E